MQIVPKLVNQKKREAILLKGIVRMSHVANQILPAFAISKPFLNEHTV